MHCGHDCRCIGRECLHEYAAPLRPATCAAGHLGDKLKRTLCGAKVWEVHCRVGVDDAHERHVRKIESLRDHLRAEQYPVMPFAETGERLLMATATAHAVGIHSQARIVWKPRAHFCFQLLRTEPA